MADSMAGKESAPKAFIVSSIIAATEWLHQSSDQCGYFNESQNTGRNARSWAICLACCRFTAWLEMPPTIFMTGRLKQLKTNP
jgi:hypothetical protein